MAKDKFSNVTCPECGTVQLMKMPKNVCQRFFFCKKCAKMISSKVTCCVVCDYGDIKCDPPHEPMEK